MDEQRDPAAELQAMIEGIIGAFRPLLQQAAVIIEAANRAGEEWLDRNRPLVEAMAELSDNPQVKALAEAKRQFGGHVVRGITEIRATHRYAFRSTKWARLVGTQDDPETGRRCYAVEFPDGATGWWPVEDKAAGYEFR